MGVVGWVECFVFTSKIKKLRMSTVMLKGCSWLMTDKLCCFSVVYSLHLKYFWHVQFTIDIFSSVPLHEDGKPVAEQGHYLPYTRLQSGTYLCSSSYPQVMCTHSIRHWLTDVFTSTSFLKLFTSTGVATAKYIFLPLPFRNHHHHLAVLAARVAAYTSVSAIHTCSC